MIENSDEQDESILQMTAAILVLVCLKKLIR